MKLAVLTLATTLLSFAAHAAEPQCTKEDKSKWKDAKAFEEGLKKDYKVKVFKVTKTNCYELYGWNKEGKKVEIYFNPVTGEVVKEHIQK